MILVTIGSWHSGFDRLIKAVDEFAKRDIINEPVKAQIGDGAYKPKHIDAFKYCSPDEFSDLIKKSSLIISHAGMGTIIEVSKHNKRLIVVPRKSKFGEANNNHQFNTAEVLEKEGRILVAYDVQDLPDKLKEAVTFVPAKNNNSSKILDEIKSFIESYAKQKF